MGKKSNGDEEQSAQAEKKHKQNYKDNKENVRCGKTDNNAKTDKTYNNGNFEQKAKSEK